MQICMAQIDDELGIMFRADRREAESVALLIPDALAEYNQKNGTNYALPNNLTVRPASPGEAEHFARVEKPDELVFLRITVHSKQ